MQGGIFSQILLAGLAAALLVASWTDIRRRQIDNGLNAAIALGAPLFWWSNGLGLVDIGWQLGVTAITFVLLLGLFAIRAMGGGDVKLLTALALWIEPAWFARLLVIMSIVGGLLTLFYLVLHRARRKRGDGERQPVAVPYGIAISLAGLWTLATQYLALPLPGQLLG